MSEETGIRADAIYSEYNKRKRWCKYAHPARRRACRRTAFTKTDPEKAEIPVRPPKAEALILNLMVKNKKYVDIVKEHFCAGGFFLGSIEKLMEIIYNMRSENKPLSRL